MQMRKIIAVLDDAHLQTLCDVLYVITAFFQWVNANRGHIRFYQREYFRHIRLEFSNDVKIHFIIMFSDQQFVDINERIHAPQVHAHRCQHYL